uniref:Replication protein A 70 kDa DNA-binding subunit B n=1 Tax=Tanacetum cinerariifolium TaxID=118510 RepID=A0A6L2LND5_TANCI|nr:hypothetical protein [Tanacetum cinerariifolium]
MFETLFQEGQCYSILNFAIAENSDKLPLLPHKHKINFFKSTVVTRIDPFKNNVNGFILEAFNRLLDGTYQYHEHEAVDVHWFVVAIGEVVPIQSAAGRKIRRTVVIEDAESNQLDFTFWDQWANMWDEYAQKRNELGHVVLFFNWESFKELPEYDESQFKIAVFTPQKPVVTIVEFFHGAVKKMVANHDAVQVASRYKVIMQIIDQSGSAPIVFFNTMINKLSGHTTWELMERHGMDVDGYWPKELLEFVSKKFLFKIYYLDYNDNNNKHIYKCDAVNDDPKMIWHFKDGFLEDETPSSGMDASGSCQSSSSK